MKFTLHTKTKQAMKIAAIFFAGAVVGGALWYAAEWYQQYQHLKCLEVDCFWKPVLPIPPTTPAPIVTPEPSTPATANTTTTGMEPDLTTESLDIVWNKKPQQMDVLKTFIHLDAVQQQAYQVPQQRQRMDVLDVMDLGSMRILENGLVKGGTYDGYKMLLLELDEQWEIGLTAMSHRRALLSPSGERMIVLSNVCNAEKNTCEKIDALPFLVHAPNLKIPSIHFFDTLHTTNGRTLVRGEVEQFGGGDAWKDPPSASALSFLSKEGVRLFESERGCLDAVTPDGEVFHYASYIPKDENGDFRVTFVHPADFTMYVSAIKGGCGGRGCADIMKDEEIGPTDALRVVGHTSEGDPLFAPKDLVSHPQTRFVYESWMRYDASGTKPPLDEFVASHPVPYFFWKDATGRWARYTDSSLIPQAECGKPVIYLYPERDTNVRVTLPGFISVTKSEPTYPVTGWETLAHPDGSLTMKDGAVYGSLYWEGIGVGYAMPKDGFVVKDGNVKTFLADILSRYGLNAREAGEFMDFWVPKMTGAPYYRVSFLTSAWSQAAPLSVSPRPRTAIRLFMDWQKLSAPISLPMPKITTPQRVGFTLVEWGGLLPK